MHFWYITHKPTLSLSHHLLFSGCDEVDYSSECLAHTAGVSVSRTGKCDGTEEFTETSSTIAVETLPEDVTETTSTVAVDTLPDGITFACEVGPSANPNMSCLDGEFCQLDVGTCNNKMGVHVGVCASIPTVCTKEFNPVWWVLSWLYLIPHSILKYVTHRYLHCHNSVDVMELTMPANAMLMLQALVSLGKASVTELGIWP